MPSFCRHNRLIQNCTICSREQNLTMRPIVSGGASTRERNGGHASGSDHFPDKPRASRAATQDSARSPARGVQVRRLSRGVEDGYRSSLVPGLRSSEDADRLAQEIAFAVARLHAIEHEPQGLWRALADSAADIEERTWLAFQIAYIGPTDSDEPFAVISAARTTWASGDAPNWEGIEPGPRGALDAGRADGTVAAYRAWAQRAGSQAAAFVGEAVWSPERRFERIYERLALPGMTRDTRFELLVLLGRSGVYELRAGKLALSGENEATWAAKRALGIGDHLLLERRAAELADACGSPLEALDLAFHNWGSGKRTGAGFPVDSVPDAAVLTQARDALGL